MRSLRSALVLTTAERYTGLILNLATLAIISRLLTPQEIGVAVIGWAILSVPFALRDFGTNDFIVQRHDLQDIDIRSAATICMASAITLVLVIYAAAPVIGYHFGDARLVEFLRLMVFAILTDAVAGPLVALMRRDMEFKALAGVNITLHVVSAAVTIGFAALGFSYMCIAWAGLLGNACAALVAVALRPQFWIYRPTLSHSRQVLKFGGYYGSMTVALRLYEALPYLALGRFLPASATGFYNRAWQVCQLPDKVILSGIVGVAFPALAAEARQGRSIKPAYLAAIEYITGVQWPALSLLFFLAPTVVHVLFGEQWTQVVPLVQIMALAALFGVVSVLIYPTLYAIGDLSNALRYTFIALPASGAVMLAVAPFGAQALALSLFLTIPLNNLLALYFIRKQLQFSARELWHAVRKSVVILVASMIGPAVIAVLNGHTFEQPIWAQALMVITSGLGWLIGLMATRHPLMGELIRLAAYLGIGIARNGAMKAGS